MSLIEREMYRFGPFSLDPTERVILRDGEPLTVTPKVFDTLVCLVRNHGRLLRKDELLKEIWPDTFVEEVNLAVNISTLRKAFGEGPQEGRYIATVPGRGYRFVAEVKEMPYQQRETPNLKLAIRSTPVPDADSYLESGRPSHSQTTRANEFTLAESRKWRPALPAAIVLLLTVAVSSYLSFGRRRTSAPVLSVPSIAVLPFADLSPAKDQEYFSDGLADELINDLATVPGMHVVARSSAFQFKGRNEDLRSVGRKLGVANILEGSVRREGDRVRVRVALTNTTDAFELWSQTYDRKIDDMFAVQEDIALSVADALQVRLRDVPATARSTNSEAYQAYLKAQYFFGRSVDEGNEQRALAYVDQAIKLDARYAPGWALRSAVLTSLVTEAFLDEKTGLRDAREAAERAIALDSNLAAGYVQLGWVQTFNDWDWNGAEVSLKKAAQLEPGSSAVLRYRSYLYQVLGQLDRAVETQKEAIALDPLRARSYLFLSYQLYCAGRYQEADVALQEALEFNPQLPSAHSSRGEIFLAQGRPQEALTQMEEESSEDWKLWGQALAYHSLGRSQDSDASLKRLIAVRHKDWAFQIAQVYAFRGEIDRSFEWLDRAYRQHDGGMTVLKVDRLLTSLRQDARWADLLKKLRLPT